MFLVLLSGIIRLSVVKGIVRKVLLEMGEMVVSTATTGTAAARTRRMARETSTSPLAGVAATRPAAVQVEIRTLTLTAHQPALRALAHRAEPQKQAAAAAAVAGSAAARADPSPAAEEAEAPAAPQRKIPIHRLWTVPETATDKSS